MADPPVAGRGAGLRVGPIAGWQAVVVFPSAAALWTAGRGAPASLVAGAVMMLASLVLQRLAVSAAFRRARRPGVALALLLLKLFLLLAFVYVGLRTALLGPLSFAAGATSLPVAIVLDVCYPQWSSRHARGLSP